MNDDGNDDDVWLLLLFDEEHARRWTSNKQSAGTVDSGVESGWSMLVPPVVPSKSIIINQRLRGGPLK